ncbi:hypothetical protein NUU61_010078 [Penicillium alfredii]|uniref:Uncharacterized protein n=1 Tax=Penicillium alfredii TaxID=1506179 RepID=A0A9W9EHC2_9EURO|nr:uncharacterized protein NUU61_010078 [Penicillium alfredii]KAJ5081814.1 hypothetical protein NUU61_010078 [Penicillium alfredii]
MPDMPTVFHQSASSPKLDLSSASSQVFHAPSSGSASSSLYSLSLSRKRPQRDTEKLSSYFEPPSEFSSPLLHTDYQANNELQGSPELDCRPNRYRESFLPHTLDASMESAAQAESAGASRKRSRRDSGVASPSADGCSPAPQAGWGRSVIKVVGKVLDFCWTGAFRGFHAGGGQGYDMSTTHPNPGQSASSPAEKNMFSTGHPTPIPGQYPEDDIERNWIVVPNNPNDPFVGSSDVASPSLRAPKTHQASSPRRRPTVMPRLGKRTRLSVRPSTPTKNARNPGVPSPRSTDGPGSAEMQRQAAKIRRQEREEDASIRRLNKQLQAMIREGKEALGTTVEVDDLDMGDY